MIWNSCGTAVVAAAADGDIVAVVAHVETFAAENVVVHADAVVGAAAVAAFAVAGAVVGVADELDGFLAAILCNDC